VSEIRAANCCSGQGANADIRIRQLFETRWADAKFAARGPRESPGFLAIVVLSLALGIAANSTIFSVLNAVLYRRLPNPQPKSLMVIWQTEVSQCSFPRCFQFSHLPSATEVASNHVDLGAVVDSTLVQVCINHCEYFWVFISWMNQRCQLVNLVPHNLNRNEPHSDCTDYDSRATSSRRTLT
jgi:hypothetical protein